MSDRSERSRASCGPRLDRRDFLRHGAAAALGAGALPLVSGGALAAEEGPRIARYVALGRTELRISDISFGSSQSDDPDLVRYAFDRGINYFDTAEGYRRGRSEEAIGAGLKGVRERAFIATKTSAGPGARRDEMMRALEGSLRRLQTDRVEVYLNHAVNDVDRLRNSEWLEFTELARRQGKIRYRGMSGHGGRLVECLEYALEHDLVDVILVAYNFGQDPAFYERFLRDFDFVALQPGLPRVLDRARERGVGVVAMKTLMGARLNDMRPHEHGGATFAQAAFRWVLSGPHAHALVVSMRSRAQVDEYVAASGASRNRRSDLELLERYAAAFGASYCQHGCRICEPSCPAGVPIPDVLRARMYDVDYGNAELARSTYAELGGAAGTCLGCAAQPCLSACPNGIPIAERTRDAARRLA
jgi:predicted aldo/keto reductase-like oxidoreductase